jgi:sec-independent protein translocase protein TatA
VIILLFGARKLPEMARSLGKSAKAFKEETKGMRNNDDEAEKPVEPPVQQQLPQSQPPTPQAQPHTNGAVPQSAEQQNKNVN